jgi:hypothetical protein
VGDAMIETYPIDNFYYDPIDKSFSVDASLLELPVGYFTEKINLRGQKETVTFDFDFAHRDSDDDVVFWAYNGQDSKSNKYVLKVYND